MVLFLSRLMINHKLIIIKSFSAIVCLISFILVMAITNKFYIIGSCLAILLAIAAGYCSVFLPTPKVEEPTVTLQLNNTVFIINFNFRID